VKIVSATNPFCNLDSTHKLSHEDILFFCDAFDKDLVDNIVNKKGRPKYICSDSFSYIDIDTDIPVYTIPLFLEVDIQPFKNTNTITEEIKTDYATNFLINKKQINRYLTIKLCELFNIDVNYTWSGIGRKSDMSIIINELNYNDHKFINDTERSFLLSPISLPPRWIEYSSSNYSNTISVENYGSNKWTWDNGLSTMVSTTAVSLITESVWTQRAAYFTEKTIYSVLGLTFPIWIGGAYHAREWRKMGFDTFDDIIDHSYESMDTLIERCWYAFKLNLDLLKDRQRLTDLRQQCLPRLLKNRELMLSDHVKKHNDSVIATWPQDLQDSIGPVLKIFKRSHL
jgi:hypothetical protein